MKISVIMPAYNSEKTIRASISSVLSQSGAEIELVVINDGSIDGTQSILDEFSGRIIAVTIPNGGVANARNIGLEKATGDYVMFVDSDDMLADDAIKKIADKTLQTGADIIRFEYVIVDENGKKSLTKNRFTSEERIVKSDFPKKIYPHFINGIRMNSLCTTAIKRELFDGVSFRTDLKTAEDAYLLTDLYTRARDVSILPKELYIYNKQEKSLTGTGLSVFKKYLCNFKLSYKLAKMLPLWNMAKPSWYFRVYLRPVVITFDKIKRR